MQISHRNPLHTVAGEPNTATAWSSNQLWVRPRSPLNWDVFPAAWGHRQSAGCHSRRRYPSSLTTRQTSSCHHAGQVCNIRKPCSRMPQAPFEKKKKDYLSVLTVEDDIQRDVTSQSHLLHSSSSCENPCKSGLHARCANEHSTKFSTLCSPSSSEKNRPSSASEDIPSIAPQAKGK